MRCLAASLAVLSSLAFLLPLYLYSEIGPLDVLSLREPSSLHALVGEITPAEILNDPLSYQYQALTWITQFDQYRCRSKARCLQRYAVALLAFALGNERILNPRQDECHWPGMTCSTHENMGMAVEKLEWADQNLLGRIPGDIRFLSTLRHLDLADNSLTGSLPEGLYELRDMQSLYLQHNRLGGTISSSVRRWRNMTNLLLADNLLTGTLPNNWGPPRAPSLRYVSFHKNLLTGKLPEPEAREFKNLWYLDLSFNQFTGAAIPRSWLDEPTDLHGMNFLYLGHNYLNGTIPPDFATIGNGRIQTLDLSHNQLTGTMPGNFTLRSFLQDFRLQGNQFDAMDASICKHVPWSGGEMANLYADCSICKCQRVCGPGLCYNKTLPVASNNYGNWL